MLDVLLGISIFAMFVSATGFALLLGQEGVLGGGDRVRATLLAERALEAARSIRDRDVAELIDGTHGIAIAENGLWDLQGTEFTTADGFTTTLTITHEAERIPLTARTTWNIGSSRSGSVTLRSELTDWRQTYEIGDWSLPSEDGSYEDADTPLFNDAVSRGDFAFVTSETSAGGAGLYVFDIANTAVPTLQATVPLGAAGYQLLIQSGHLLVVTGLSASEVEVYKLDNPATLSASDRIATINVPGDGRVRTIASHGNTLFLGALHHATEAELYSYDASDLGSITLLDTVDDDGGYLDLSLHDGFAYIASDYNTSELRIGDVFDPANLSVEDGYNLSDVQDGVSVAAFGTSALLGRADGSAISELILFSLEAGPVPAPPPGPWSQDTAGVHGISVEPAGRYAFVATENDTKTLQVIDVPRMSAGLQPEAAYFATDTGAGRGVFYDFKRDRVFLMTNTAFIILKPGP